MPCCPSRLTALAHRCAALALTSAESVTCPLISAITLRPVSVSRNEIRHVAGRNALVAIGDEESQAVILHPFYHARVTIEQEGGALFPFLCIGHHRVEV